jgi:hypothetical protein
MKAMTPDETEIVGRWTIAQGRVASDENCQRISDLVGGYLLKIGHDSSGWSNLYRDPGDGRFWELTYPQSNLHGGGPPELRCLSQQAARSKYGSVIGE